MSTRHIPKSIPGGRETDFGVKAPEFYNCYLQKQWGRKDNRTLGGNEH